MPVILDLGYYHCPSLCGVARADLFDALGASGLARRPRLRWWRCRSIRRKRRGAADAKARRSRRMPSTDRGRLALPDRCAQRPLPRSRPLSGSARATTRGCASSCIRPGWSCSPPRHRQRISARRRILRRGPAGSGRARRDGEIARAASPVLLLCFHFDAITGRYTLAIEKVLRLMGLLTVVTLGGLMILLHRRRPGGLSMGLLPNHPRSPRKWTG